MQIRTSSGNFKAVIYDERTIDSDFPVHLPEGVTWTPAASSDHLHYHHNFELGYCLSGSGIFFIGKKIIPFCSGDISVIYPNEIHICQSLESDPSTWVFITVDMQRLFETDSSHTAKLFSELTAVQGKCGGIYQASSQPKMASLLHELTAELRDRPPEYRFMSRTIISMLILELWRAESSGDDTLASGINSAGASISNAPEPRAVEIILPAISFISRNYAEAITARQLAELCHISEVHLRRLFASVVGSSPFEYLYRVRINAACAALSAENVKSISEIAADVGYASISSFNRHFKKYAGSSPRGYKR